MFLFSHLFIKKIRLGGFFLFNDSWRKTITTGIRTAIPSVFAHIGICFTRTATIRIRIRTTITCNGRRIFCGGFWFWFLFFFKWILNISFFVIFKAKNLLIVFFGTLWSILLELVFLILNNSFLLCVIGCFVCSK